MALPEHKKQFLGAVGFQSSEIAAIEETLAKLASKAKQDGLRSKEETPAVVEPEKNGQEEKPVVAQQPDVDTQLKEATAMLVKALEPVIEPLRAELAALKAEVESMKVKESLTPAASLLSSKSILNQDGEHVVTGKGDKTPKENNSDKDKRAAAVTGIPFLDNIIALNEQRTVGG